jgi:signal transduction histidine kinase
MRSRSLLVLGLATAWWTLSALVSAANWVGLDGAAWRHALVSSWVAAFPWIFLTVALDALTRRLPIRRPHLGRRLAVYLAVAAAVIVLRAGWIFGLDPWMHWYTVPVTFTQVLLHSVQNNFFLYWLVVGVAHAGVYAADALERARVSSELEAALARAELSAMAATLNPHFLFNTLQAVAEMVHRDPHATDRMIVQLSAMLRQLLDDRRASVPLRDELAFSRDYLALEEVRFGELLTVRWEIDPAAEAMVVPRLSIQPLIENALRHGLWPAGRPGTLVIGAKVEGETLVVSVTDDGLGLGPPKARVGQGLATVRARLDRLYPGRGAVALADRPGQGATARVVIPCAS